MEILIPISIVCAVGAISGVVVNKLTGSTQSSLPEPQKGSQLTQNLNQLSIGSNIGKRYQNHKPNKDRLKYRLENKYRLVDRMYHKSS